MLRFPSAEVAMSVIAPMPTEWWLRPVNIACLLASAAQSSEDD